jgi:hypothetical protein
MDFEFLAPPPAFDNLDFDNEIHVSARANRELRSSVERQYCCCNVLVCS